MYLKIEAGLISQSHYFLQGKSDILNEERVDERIDDFSMFISWMFIKDNLILHKEVRNIVVEIYCFGDGVDTNQLT